VNFSPLLEARLLRRYKRFLADVELSSGEQLTAHCPNTGAMTGCAESGSRVWLSTSDSKTRKYPHTWELVETAHGIACVHSSLANAVVREAVELGRIPQLAGYPTLRSEAKYGKGSRADLQLEDGSRRVLVEVKSVTLCGGGGQGLFPDAVSDRGRKHLHELMAARDQDTRAVMLFCVLHAGINRVSAAGAIDPRYREALAEAMAAGVEVLAWKARITPRGIDLFDALPFQLDPAP
jgi:sugar fermentation stimulation protein A